MRASLQVTGAAAVRQRVLALPALVRAAARDELGRQIGDLRSYVVTRKLGGQVLKPASGGLARSLHTTVTERADIMRATLGSSLTTARLHEYGGTIRVPPLRPRTAEAMRFEENGRTVFATSTRAHPATYPARSFLRTALAERAQAILAAIAEAIRRAVRGSR